MPTQAVLVPSDPAYSRVLAIASTRLVQRLTQLLDALESGDEIPMDLITDLRTLCNRSMPNIPEAIARSGEWTGARPGTGHFLWHGTIDSRTGIPVISRWYNDAGDLMRNVPVYRILWPYSRSDELVGRPHKNEACTARNCASPLCYGPVIPMVTRGFENPGVRYRRRGAWARRPVWHSSRGGLAGEAPHQYPVCTQCKQRLHMGDLHLGDFIERYEGKQVNCNTCKINDDAIRAAAGLRGPADAYDYSNGYGPRNEPERYEVNGQRVSKFVWNAVQQGREEDRRRAQLGDDPDEDVDNAT